MFIYPHHLHADYFQAALLKPCNYLSDKPSLHSIGLYKNKRFLYHVLSPLFLFNGS